MIAIDRAGQHVQVGIGVQGIAHQLGDLGLVVDGDDQKPGLGDAGRLQEVGPGGVAEMDLEAEGAQGFKMLGAVIDHSGRVAGRGEHAVDNPAKAAMAGNDDLATGLDRIIRARRARQIVRHDHLVEQDEEGRGQQH